MITFPRRSCLVTCYIMKTRLLALLVLGVGFSVYLYTRISPGDLFHVGQDYKQTLNFTSRLVEPMYSHFAKTWFHSGAEQVPAPSATSEERRQHYEEASLPAALEQAQRTFEQRREHYRQACAETAASPYFRPFTVNQPSFIQAYHIAFCPIAKTGTTLWRKILYSVRTNKVDIENKTWGPVNRITRSWQTRAGHLRGNDVKTVVFVREPYSRLFSAYVDKLFQPKHGNWFRYGFPVLQYIYNLTKSDKYHSCSSHVTFPEFIRYFIDSETGLAPAVARNRHFVPQSQHCGFCTGLKEQDIRSYWEYRQVVPQRPDGSNHGSQCADNGTGQRNCSEEWRSGFVHHFIAKTEDISHDTHAIFELTNLTSKLPPNLDIDVNVRRNLIKNTIEKKIFRDGLKNRHTLSCMSKEEVLRRQWKNFQIRGMLSKRELFPLPSAAADVIGMADFQALALSAFDRSQKDPDLKKNRRIAMAEAYGTITLEDRNTLRAIFSRDFQLFGYPATIPEVFPENDEFPSERYRFFDIFDNSAKAETSAKAFRRRLGLRGTTN